MNEYAQNEADSSTELEADSDTFSGNYHDDICDVYDGNIKWHRLNKSIRGRSLRKSKLEYVE